MLAAAICAACAAFNALPANGMESGDAPAPSVVARAIVDGERALAARDARSLMAAAATLAESQARPAAGDDLARLWAHQAVLWGAKPQAVSARRGRILGPGYRQLDLPPGARFRTRQVFAAGQDARVEVVALSPGTFSLAVTEDGLGEVCRHSGAAGQIACKWVPSFSAPHDITVENGQSRTARFYLVTY